MTSTRCTGVAASCSMVPRSHSRAIVSEDSIAATTIITTAISPGTIMLLLFSSSLYQTRLSVLTGAASVVEGDGGGVGVAAVHQRLHRRRPARAEVAREARRHDQHHPHRPALEQRPGVGAAGGRG